MDLAAVTVGADVGLGDLVSGWATVTAQFIFTTANLSHDRRPRMAGLGVSVTYQYECTLWGQVPGPPGHQVMGPQSAPQGYMEGQHVTSSSSVNLDVK